MVLLSHYFFHHCKKPNIGFGASQGSFEVTKPNNALLKVDVVCICRAHNFRSFILLFCLILLPITLTNYNHHHSFEMIYIDKKQMIYAQQPTGHRLILSRWPLSQAHKKRELLLPLTVTWQAGALGCTFTPTYIYPHTCIHSECTYWISSISTHKHNILTYCLTNALTHSSTLCFRYQHIASCKWLYRNCS